MTETNPYLGGHRRDDGGHGMRLELGSRVVCRAGPYGELDDVVIDPVTLCATHLVVQPRHRHGLARLVPIEGASLRDTAVWLPYTAIELERLPLVEQLELLRIGSQRASGDTWDAGIETVLATPFTHGGYGVFDVPGPDADASFTVAYDRIPRGEVEIRRASRVIDEAGDDLGHVRAFVVDSAYALLGVVLERGHAWRRREVTIPIDVVSRLDNDVVMLRITKNGVDALPRAHARQAA